MGTEPTVSPGESKEIRHIQNQIQHFSFSTGEARICCSSRAAPAAVISLSNHSDSNCSHRSEPVRFQVLKTQPTHVPPATAALAPPMAPEACLHVADPRGGRGGGALPP